MRTFLKVKENILEIHENIPVPEDYVTNQEVEKNILARRNTLRRGMSLHGLPADINLKYGQTV